MTLREVAKVIGQSLFNQKVFALLVVFTLLGLAVNFFLTTLRHRFSYHPPSMDQLIYGLDPDYKFKTDQLRSLAQCVYQHRAAREHDPNAHKKYIGFFPRLYKNTVPPNMTDLKDIALYRLIVAPPEQFSVRLAYLNIFNHKRYVECLKNYNPATMSFSTEIRKVIIDELLGIEKAAALPSGEATTISSDEDTNAAEAANAAAALAAAIAAETAKTAEAGKTIRDCLERTQLSYDLANGRTPNPAAVEAAAIAQSIAPNASNKLISMVLESYPDADLYQLILHGYIGSQ